MADLINKKIADYQQLQASNNDFIFIFIFNFNRKKYNNNNYYYIK